MHRNRRGATIAASALIVGGLTVAALGAPAVAAPQIDTSRLTDAVTVDGITTHLQAFQDIADANGGNRAAGTSGYDESLAYVKALLDEAGYLTTVQPFSYEYTDYTGSTLAQTAPGSVTYTLGVDFFPMTFSPAGTAVGSLEAVDVNLVGDRASTSGCESTDFATFTPGSIALIQRGSCDFSVKAANAVEAGAIGVIIFNQGNTDPTQDRFGVFGGTLSTPDWADPLDPVPVVGTSFAVGEALAMATDPAVALTTVVTPVKVDTANLLADTPTGRADRTVVVGAHLDSVPEGPGINDNGSGSATILETALQLAELGVQTENRVRFAFWGGEEDGLIGSSYYVSQLSKAQIKQHLVNLNFDMVGSPNGVRFVYDGDGNAFGLTGPNGSAVIEGVFNTWFASQGLKTEPTEFDGRSDYFAFIEAGIPAGGLFSGAEGVKTAAQAAIYGGTAGEWYDPCYHQACDQIGNISDTILDQLADATANATLVFAETESAVNGTAKGKALGQFNPDYKGNSAVR